MTRLPDSQQNNPKYTTARITPDSDQHTTHAVALRLVAATIQTLTEIGATDLAGELTALAFDYQRRTQRTHDTNTTDTPA